MYKAVLIGFGLVLAVVASFGQVPKNLLVQIKNSKPDTSRVKFQLQLADYYIKSDDQTPAQLDSALALANKALLLARSLSDANWENKALWSVGETYYQKKDTVNGMACFARSRNDNHKKGDYLNEARAWNKEGAVYPPSGKAAAVYRLKCYNNALAIFNRLNRPIEIAEVIQNKAEVHTDNAELSLAEKELMQVLALYKKSGYKRLDHTYSMLAQIYSINGNPDTEVFYLLEAVKNMQATGDSANASEYYYKLSTAYTIIGKREDGLTWLRKAMAANKGFDVYMYTDMVNELTALKRTKEALDTINALAKRPPPAKAAAKLALYKSIGFCYSKLSQNAKAEEYYLKMMAVDLSELKQRNIFIYLSYYLSGNDAISWFYINTNQHEKAREYLNNMLAVYKSPPAAVHPVYRMNTYQGMYKVEYAAHHFREAIDYLQLHKNLYDSVFNADKNRQLEEFKIKYETEKKEQAIKVLQAGEQQAVLQRNFKQAELQKVSLQRDIQAGELVQAGLEHKVQQARLQKVTLQQKAESQKANFQRNMQAAEIQKANTQRNITFGGTALSLIILGLAYNGYRNKQLSNHNLLSQQIEINQQNNHLQQLLSEKDWLLKEVHHRVKNNLQIVMSLLSSQSAYLENNAAVEAIRESRNRMQAISLIHQKLYSSNNVASINMRAYVADLMNYLDDTFDARRRGIYIEQMVELLYLDIVQAVPLGLILNESVTNAIKYAFDDKGGQIVIGVQLIKDENLLLTITDNGKGLPNDFDIKTTSTLGVEMMKALTKQLGGEFKVKNNSGVSISIEFQVVKMLHDVPENIM